MRSSLKRAAERAALFSGIPALSRLIYRRRSLVLMYHNVRPDGEPPAGELSLHLPQRDFAQQLDCLCDECDVVPLEELIWGGHARQSKRRRVAITFDDAYKGAVTVGVDELAKRGMPATIFAAPARFSESAWWDRLAQQSGGEIPRALRTELLEAAAGKEETIQARLVTRGLATDQRKSPTVPVIADLEQLMSAAARPGIAIGSHSWSHPNLAALSDGELHSELARSLAWLGERFESFVPVVAYPYGLYSARVERAASAAGYRAGLLASGGWLPRAGPAPAFALPRLGVPSGISYPGFRLRLSGVGLA